MGDWDDVIGRKWWDMHIDLLPYTRSIDIFLDPASGSPKPEQRLYTGYNFTDNGVSGNPIAGDPGTTGMFWTNVPVGLSHGGAQRPIIMGHFTRNDELLHNHGFDGASGGVTNTASNASTWRSTSDKVMFSFAKGVGDDKDGNNWNDNNAPYFEPGSTNWNNIFALVATRHQDGAPFVMLDGHAKYRKAVWLQSMEGKKALNPACSQLPNTTNWVTGAATNCTYQEE